MTPSNLSTLLARLTRAIRPRTSAFQLRGLVVGAATPTLLILAAAGRAEGQSAPSDVRNFTATADGKTAINLTWDAPADTGSSAITSYSITNFSFTSFTWETIATVDDTIRAHKHTGLSAGSTYNYQIVATNSAGSSQPVTASGTTAAATPGIPTNLMATADGQTAIDLSWTAPADTGASPISGYKIEVLAVAGGSWADLVADTDTTATAYKHTGLSADTTLFYRVSAINAQGTGDVSTTATGTTDAEPMAPDRPTNLTATALDDTAIDLTWTAPTNTGGSAISGYRIEISTDRGTNWSDEVANTNSTTTAYSDTGLDHFTRYDYRVSAINATGTGDPSDVAHATTDSTPTPWAPTNLVATAVDTITITLSWTAPSYPGTSAINGYRIEASLDGGTTWADWASNTGTITTTYRQTDLLGGTYHFQVSAINGSGAGPPSNVDQVRITGPSGTALPPAAPTGLTATAVDSTRIDLSWTAPTDTGTSAITAYRIEVSSDSAASWTDLVANTGSTAMTYQHTGLSASTTRHYRVSAINGAGQGLASNVANATTRRGGVTASPPGAPTNLRAAAASATEIDLSWTAPADTGTSAITGYRIEVSTDGGGTWTNLAANTASTATTYRDTGLAIGVTRHYRVRAINTAGTSDPSNVAFASTSAAVPGAPTNLEAEAVSPTEVELDWDAPASDGGSPITGYRIEYRTDGGQWTDLEEDTESTATSHTHRRASAGTRYYYRVRAINAVGESDPSNRAEATTEATAPDAPTGLVARAVDEGRIDLSWTAPQYDGGSEIIGYRIEVSYGSVNWEVLTENTESPTTTWSHTDLDPNTEATYRVAAVNARGHGAYSNMATARTDATVPGAPRGLNARPVGTDRIDLSWTPPLSDGGAEIEGYRILVSGSSGGFEVLVNHTGTTETSWSHTGLDPGTQHRYQVQAINDAGVGPSSNISSARTNPVESDPPRNLEARSGGTTSIVLTWEPPHYAGGTQVTGYRIEVHDGTAWAILEDDAGPSTTYTHRGLEPGDERRYRVRALSVAGVSKPSNEAFAATDPVVPDPPRDLEARAYGPHRIDLDWRAPAYDGGADIVGYRIHILPDGEDVWRVLEENTGTTDTRYSHTRLEPATENSYRVSAVNAAGASYLSAPATARTAPVVPDPPEGLRAEAKGPYRIDLEWYEPGYTGGVPVTGYRIEAYDGTLWTALVSDTRSGATFWSHTDLAPGSEWRYRVSAINEAGASEPSDVAAATTDAIPPDAPVGLDAEADGPYRIELEWRTPAYDGGADIVGYQVDVLSDGEGVWRVLEENTGTADTRYTHPGLAPATTNSYRVSAINRAGASEPSETATARTDPVVPDPPENLSAEANGPYGIDLEWDKPLYTGGVPVTGYMIEGYDGALWTVLEANTKSGATSWNHTDLDPGSEWRYRVSAINEAGASEPSDMATATTDAIAPDPPVGLQAEADGARRIRLDWIAPDYTGGAPVTGYLIEGSRGDAVWTVVAETSTTLTSYMHRDLEPASTWYYRVSAINRAGPGTPSEMATATTDPVAPDPPTSLRAEARGAYRIDLSWAAPAYSGGAPVTGYRIEMSEDGGASWGMLETDTRSEATLFGDTDVRPGSTRHYRVSAINRAGVGEPSQVAFATTEATVPEAPAELQAVAIDHERIGLSWAVPPFDGGAPITGYRIEYSMDGGVSWEYAAENTRSRRTEHVHDGLKPATTYHYRIAAINEKGAGSVTEPVSARTDATVPDAPANLEASATTPRRITLTWDPPEYDGGAAVTSYRVEVSLDGDEWAVLDDTDGPDTEYAHDGLAPGDTRHYRVSATNEAGTGEPSNVASATTDDPVERAARVNEAILPRFASAVTAGIVEAIGERARAAAAGAGDGLRAGSLMSARDGGLRAVLGGSQAARGFGGLSTWASAGVVSQGAPGGPGVRWDGGLFSAHAGSDVRLKPNLLAGLAVSRSSGDYDWTDATGGREVAGTYDARMTSVTPYAAWLSDGGASVWTAASYGRGNVEIDDELAGMRESSATMMTGAAGVTGRLLANGSGALNVRAEGWASWMDLAESEGVDALEFQVRRMRAVLEWAQLNRFEGGHVVGLLVNGGARYEVNEGVDDVNGVELGGGLRYSSPARRFGIEGRGRFLLAIDSDYEEWGVGANIRIDPGGGGGLALNLAPSYGQAESGVETLWTNGVTAMAEPGRSKFAVQTEYRFGGGLASTPTVRPVPYARAELLGPARGLWVGARLNWLALEGTYDRTGAALSAKGAWRW